MLVFRHCPVSLVSIKIEDPYTYTPSYFTSEKYITKTIKLALRFLESNKNITNFKIETHRPLPGKKKLESMLEKHKGLYKQRLEKQLHIMEGIKPLDNAYELLSTLHYSGLPKEDKALLSKKVVTYIIAGFINFPQELLALISDYLEAPKYPHFEIGTEESSEMLLGEIEGLKQEA